MDLLKKYADKLVRAGLTEAGGALIGRQVRNAETLWNRNDRICGMLEKVMSGIRKEAILFAEPAEPYRTIIDYLIETSGGVIKPRDFETRIFLQDLPVLEASHTDVVVAALKQRRAVILPGPRIVTFGKSDPERAFVMFSSVCFACFVKFFSDTLYHVRRNDMDKRRRSILQAVLEKLDALPDLTESLQIGPFKSEDETMKAMEEAGRLMVDCRLVDSNFGNISYFADPLLYISRKGGALDELWGNIVSVALDGSPQPETASTEFPAHREIVLHAGRRAVLHGHPKFAVILSMDCNRPDCEPKDECHRLCPHDRVIGNDIPVVSGEAGGGPFGLVHTVPQAMRGRRGVIVYGHGLFTAGEDDFNDAFRNLADIEKVCRQEYIRRVS